MEGAGDVLSITLARALAFRLHRQHLLSPAPSGLDAIGSLIGAQAQVQSAAVLQIRARSKDTTEAGIRAQLDQDRSLVKLWAQRATLHLLCIDDLPMILALRRRFTDRYRQWLMSEGLTSVQVDRLSHAICETLMTEPHSRADLSASLAPKLGDWAKPWLEHSWGGAIKLASTLGLVCQGPRRAGETTFVRLDQWVDLPGDGDADLMGALVRRYLRAFGPATAQDFAKFSGLGVGDARAALSKLARELLAVSVDGQQSFALKEDEDELRAADAPADRITVLPHFDPYLLGHAETGQFLAPRFRKRVYRIAGWIAPTILRGGKVIATWQPKRQGGRRWSVDIMPFERFGKLPARRAERQLNHLAAALDIKEVETRLSGLNE